MMLFRGCLDFVFEAESDGCCF